MDVGFGDDFFGVEGLPLPNLKLSNRFLHLAFPPSLPFLNFFEGFFEELLVGNGLGVAV